MYREMDRFRRDRQAYISAHRAHVRASIAAGDYEEPPTTVDLDCYHLCGRCGFMTRSDRDSCPACTSEEWIDLANIRAADEMRDLEASERLHIPRIQDVIAIAIPTGAALAWCVVFYQLGAEIAFAGPAFLILLPLYRFLRRRLAKLFRRLTSKRPIRWRMPAPASQRDSDPDRHEGVATGDDLIDAPFTGKPCLAYKISVLFDAPGDARPPEWVLAEVESKDFSVGDFEVEGDHVHIDVPAEEIMHLADVNPALNLRDFLRARGLFDIEGDHWLFESRVEPGARMVALVHDEGRLVTVDAAEG